MDKLLIGTVAAILQVPGDNIVSASQEVSGPAIEADQLESLIEAAGVDGLNDILDAFWRSTDNLLEAIEKQIADGDLDEAAKTAHAIKGSAANVGASLLAAVAKRMECACRENDNSTLVQSTSNAREAVHKTRDAISALVSKAS